MPVELSDACKFYPANKRCEITTPYQSIENNKQYDFSLFIDRVEVSNSINYGSLSSVSTEYGGSIKNFYNYGTITNELTPNASNNIHIENYGTMGDIVFDSIQ